MSRMRSCGSVLVCEGMPHLNVCHMYVCHMYGCNMCPHASTMTTEAALHELRCTGRISASFGEQLATIPHIEDEQQRDALIVRSSLHAVTAPQ